MATILIMCTNQRWIYNKYSNQRILVKCRKCKACQQESARRHATDIRRHGKKNELQLFLTFTYMNEFIPYIDKNDYIYFSRFGKNYLPCLPVYRNSKMNTFFDKKSNSIVEEIVPCKQVLDYIPIDDKDCFDLIKQYPRIFSELKIKMSDILGNEQYTYQFHYLYDLIQKLPFIKGNDFNTLDYVSVPYYKDIQNFFKRLYQYLKRHNNYDVKKLSFFCCSELGKTSARAHFHSILWCPPKDYFIIKRAVIACWKFCNSYQRRNKLVQIAKSPSRYVAGYVTKSFGLPAFFKTKHFKPRFSASKNFRFSLEAFQQKEVIQSFQRGTLEFDCNIIRKGGTVDVATLPLPKYVINRYFPKCSGFGWFTRSEMEKYIYKPSSLFKDLRDNNNYLFDRLKHFFDSPNPHVQFSQIFKFYKKFIAYEVKIKKLALSANIDLRIYISMIYDIWSLYYSKLHKKLHEEVTNVSDYFNGFYDNILDYYDGSVISEFLDSLMPFVNTFSYEPNKFLRNIEETNLLVLEYDDMELQRNISDSFLEKDTFKNYEFTK